MRNLRLEICYDGSRYRGWQRLADSDNTIQGKLEAALCRILDEPIEIHGSGRTDAGVHAWGQVANFHCISGKPSSEILRLLRQYLPDDIGIYSCEEVSERFHSRLNAKNKTYRYRIWNSDEPCVFDRRFVYIYPHKLDLRRMQEAGAYFLGEHDFLPFSTSRGKKKSTVRQIDRVYIERLGNEIRISITADGFLYNMMRIIVGTLIEVGAGERSADCIPSLFFAKRSDTGFLAPAQGLCLMEVTY